MEQSKVDERHEDLKCELRKRGVALARIAADLNVSRTFVSRALLGRCRSVRVESAVAEILGKPAATLWPERYKGDSK